MIFINPLSLSLLLSLAVSIQASNSNPLHNNNVKIHRIRRSENSTNKHLVAQAPVAIPTPTDSNGGGFLGGLLSVQASIASNFGFTAPGGNLNTAITTSTSADTPTLAGIQTPTPASSSSAIRTSIKTALTSVDPSTSTSTTILSPSVVIVNVTSTLSPSSSSSIISTITTTTSASAVPTSINPVTVLSTAQALTSTSLLTPTPSPTAASTASLASSNTHMSTPAKVTVVTLIIIGSSIAVLLIAFTAFRKFGFGKKSGKWESRTRAPSTFWEPHPENRDMSEVVLNDSRLGDSRNNMSGRNSEGEWIGFDEDARSIRSGRSGQGMAGVGAPRSNYPSDRPISPEFSRPSSLEDNRVAGYATVERYGSSGGRSYKH